MQLQPINQRKKLKNGLKHAHSSQKTQNHSEKIGFALPILQQKAEYSR